MNSLFDRTEEARNWLFSHIRLKGITTRDQLSAFHELAAALVISDPELRAKAAPQLQEVCDKAAKMLEEQPT